MKKIPNFYRMVRKEVPPPTTFIPNKKKILKNKIDFKELKAYKLIRTRGKVEKSKAS